MDDRVPELVNDLQDQLTAELMAALPAGTLAPQDAKIIGIKVTRFVTDNWGGQLIYFLLVHYCSVWSRSLFLVE